ncbi:MAG: membrane dipeptidase [Clostridia bacterium]|nr:membrane dipeptidase [Clostridia bacterium]
MYFFDAHCDYLSALWQGKPTALTERAVQKANLQKSVLAAFEGGKPDRERVFAQAALMRTAHPVNRPFFALEGLGWAENDDDFLWIREQKPFYVGPMWNRANRFGGSCMEDAPITAWGKARLRAMEENGIYVDLAHAGEKMFYSACDALERVLVSHANVYECCAHPRNLHKNQIRVLIEKKAFLGLTFYVPFVGGDTLDALFRHIEAVCDMGGEEILGFGSDFDGCSEVIEGATDVSLFARIEEEMEKRNYPSVLREKIAHGNLEKNKSG